MVRVELRSWNPFYDFCKKGDLICDFANYDIIDLWGEEPGFQA
jgi:hypothetical protein